MEFKFGQKINKNPAFEQTNKNIEILEKNLERDKEKSKEVDNQNFIKNNLDISDI